MARRDHAEHVAGARHLHAEAAQDVLDLAARNLDAEQARHALGPQGHARALRLLRFRLGQHRRARAAARDLGQQPGRALERAFLAARIHAALEALRGVGDHSVTAGAPGDRIRCEERHLEEHVGRVRGDAALLAPHHAREADRRGRIRDHQRVGIDRDLPAVEQPEPFARAREAHVDARVEAAQVIGVHRLAELEHHVVRDVHDRADRPQTGAAQALAHPLRRARLRIHALDHAARESRAGRRRLQAHLELRPMRGGDRLDRGRRQPAPGDGRDFARDADHRLHVAPVRRHVQHQDRVVECERLAQALPGPQAIGQVEDALVVLGQAELARRAQHARGLDAAQRRARDREAARKPGALERERRLHPGMNVGCAADDRERLAAARDLADGQLVGPRMALDRQHLADHDAGEGLRGRLDRLDLDTAHGQARAQGRGIPAGVDPLVEPCEADAHLSPG